MKKLLVILAFVGVFALGFGARSWIAHSGMCARGGSHATMCERHGDHHGEGMKCCHRSEMNCHKDSGGAMAGHGDHCQKMADQEHCEKDSVSATAITIDGKAKVCCKKGEHHQD